MHPLPLELLRRTLEPVVAEFVRLALLFTIAMGVVAALATVIVLGVNLAAAWREARGAVEVPTQGRAATDRRVVTRTNPARPSRSILPLTMERLHAAGRSAPAALRAGLRIVRTSEQPTGARRR